MRRYLLDTNVVSEPLRARPDAKLLQRLREHEASAALAAPVWHEMVHGAELLPPSRKREVIERYLNDVVHSSFPIYPYDETAAHWHARERARLARAGLTPSFVDGQIAAVARVNGLILVTRNRRHFESFADLEIQTWGEPRI